MSSAGRTIIAGIMRVAVMAALLAASATASGQAPAAENPDSPCDPATETCADAPPGSGADPEPAADDESDVFDPDLEGGPGAAVEEDPGIEASADEVFTPGDEISEDYPIPLPSDI